MAQARRILVHDHPIKFTYFLSPWPRMMNMADQQSRWRRFMFVYDDQVRTRDALAEFLARSGPWNRAATWVFNREVSLEFARNRLKEFDARVSRWIFGKKHHLRTGRRRVNFVAIPARVGHLHLHGLVYVPAPDSRLDLFEQIAPAMWQKLVPSGNLDIREFTDVAGWIKYATHNRGGLRLVEDFILSGEFHRLRTHYLTV